MQIFRKSNLDLLMIGKNRLEVEEILGSPDGKSLNSKNEHIWDYRRIAMKEDTGEIFDWTLITLTFSTGKCSNIIMSFENMPTVLMESFE